MKHIQPPKGTRDVGPDELKLREYIFNKIRNIFKLHGAVEIDTPVFELRENLMGKYGEDSKLIYDLADQGGEQLSLRYDLTVPLARYCANTGFKPIKRFQIAKVYRRDNISIKKGRFREFYQCDFDIVGSFAPMVPEAEILNLATEIFDSIPEIGPVIIKINHRKLLNGIFELCKIPQSKFRTVCSSIDKLDKMPWENIKAEIIYKKGLSADTANRISKFILQSGPPRELLDKAKVMFEKSKTAMEALSDIELLLSYTSAMGITNRITLDFSLARGLDYYTGLIYEIVKENSDVGSISGGGRYDDLLGMFSRNKKIPAAGISFGVERIFATINKKIISRDIDVRIIPLDFMCDNRIMETGLKLVSKLWSSGIRGEIIMKNIKPSKIGRVIGETANKGIPLLVILGLDEIESKTIKLKNLITEKEIEIQINEFIDIVTVELQIETSQ